jgi:selenocysteine-specific elongation factor
MKKRIIFGTAGHIDHGKSTLIKSLTGKDPDRLKEEKEKKITIELGFAGLELPEASVSFVDVPGHEGLIKTMISGSVGFDAVLFCVDGKEGIMPQTVEHFNIIKTIGVKQGIVAITKSDTCSDK